MTAAATIHELRPAAGRIAGYVEAVTTDRVLGWAWSPADPDIRVTVELRLDGAIIATAEASLPREDLIRGGIGDGRHAFELIIPPDYRPRAAELGVHAHTGDGAAVRIGAPQAAPAVEDRLTALTRGMEMVLNAQRNIHRDLRDALAGRGEAPGAVELHAATQDQIAAVEQFVIRLDAHLAKLADEPGHRPAVSRTAIWALGVSGISLAASVASLIHVLAG